MTRRSPLTALALRLRPGVDLKRELAALATREQLRAGVVLTCVGSLTRVNLRHADRAEGVAREGHFEILSLVGTLAPGGVHLHLAVADGDGVTFGGHLLDGCTVFTTAEVVVGELDALQFAREPDAATGFRELVVTVREGVAPVAGE